MAREIRILQREREITAIVVTHDQSEAMAMADRLVVMRDGIVEQVGRQEDLYERPATPFVAGFIGQSNLLRGRLTDNAAVMTEGGSRIALAGRYAATGPACLAVRPESIRLSPAGAADARTEGTVRLCTYLGAVLEHVVQLDDGGDVIVRGPGLGPQASQRHEGGTRVSLTWSASAERVFDKESRPAATLAEPEPVITQGENRSWTS
jgi:putative spermidine/putrescine transport system ATP-binding protein